jgi:hypothetical protein
MGKGDLKFCRKEHKDNDDKVLNKYYTRKTPSSSSRNINFHKKQFHQPEKLVHLSVYHQNIRGLRRKELEILSHLYTILPHILCFSEHHVNY